MSILARFRSLQSAAGRRRAALACGAWASGPLIMLGTLLAQSAEAQTVAVGPYYATPAWDQTLPCTASANCPRFIVLSNFQNNAVLDRETGLVWERSPTTTVFTYFNAQQHCLDLDTGGRKGWRLPGIQDLLSLVDPSVSSVPHLPVGHPFASVGPPAASPYYWSDTASASYPEGVWVVNFNAGTSNFFVNRDANSTSVWCVRGGAT